MIKARIFDGDIVFIREQSDVEDGEIAAVLIDDEAINITEDDGKDVEILGKAFAFQSKI